MPRLPRRSGAASRASRAPKPSQSAPASAFFFSSSLADVSLRLGPYMSISSEKKFVQRTQLVQMSRQIKPQRQQKTQNHQHTTIRKSPSETCVSSENAANKNKNQTKHKQKTGPEPKKNTHKINLPRDTVV